MYLRVLVMNKTPGLTNYAWISIFIISCISLYISSHTRISWDISWLLEAANRLTEGGSYTHNFFEANPPLIIYIYSLAILISPIFGSKVFSVLFLNYSIALISILMSYPLLKRICRADSGLLNCLLITLCFAELILPSTDFGQREDLTLMLIMPYLFVCSLRLENQNFKPSFLLACGLMAGVGFSIKPHFIIPLSLIFIWVLYKKRDWKPCFSIENLSILGVMCFYVLSVPFFNPDYFQKIFPLAFHYYLNYWKSPWWALANDPLALCVLFTLLATWIRIQLNKAYQQLTQILMLANLGFLIIFFAQSQDWYYHLLPCLILSLLLLALNLALIIQEISINYRFSSLHYLNLLNLLNLIGCLLCCLYIVSFSIMLNLVHIDIAFDEHDLVNQLLKKFKSIPDGPFMVISTSMEPNSSLLSYSGRHSSSRSPMLWLLPASLKPQFQAGNPALAKAGLQLTRKIVIEDLQENPPNIILIDNYPEKKYLPNIKFDYLDFLEKDPKFRAIWKNYHFDGQIDGFLIYVRND